MVRHVTSKLEPSQTNKKTIRANQSISQQLKSQKETKEIGDTIGKSNNEKKLLQRVHRRPCGRLCRDQSKAKPKQLKSCKDNQSMSKIKKAKKTRKIGITVDKSNNQKKRL